MPQEIAALHDHLANRRSSLRAEGVPVGAIVIGGMTASDRPCRGPNRERPLLKGACLQEATLAHLFVGIFVRSKNA
ncbi:hypothetical protein GW17_00003766 [Ensete ventricosum]|nr:hypothetical protein GW17_00003766 [Ensete ventricosum]RZS22856.1 hypothetical protein BHM03_00055686 [Ensete ventricosum]